MNSNGRVAILDGTEGDGSAVRRWRGGGAQMRLRWGVVGALLLALGCGGDALAPIAAQQDAVELHSARATIAQPTRDDAALLATPFRDYTRYPVVVQSDSSADIYAVSDIHGDYDRLVALLVRYGLLARAPTNPAAATWAGGAAVLVVTGDVIDKWDGALPALALLQALATDAERAGGRVLVTAGNHEAEFLADPTTSKADDFIAELRAAGIAPGDVAAGRNALGQYLRSLPIAARVRDWFFCHAGNTGGRTLAKLTADVEKGLNKSGFGAAVLSDDASILEARVEPTPWWETGRDPAGTLRSHAAALGVAHIVMGHQPGKYTFADGEKRSKGTIVGRYGVLFLTDVGMSRGIDYSSGALLRIHTAAGKTTATALYGDGRTKTVYSN